MGDGARADRLQVLGMLASALAGQAVAVDGLSRGEPVWTDGQTIFVDAAAGPLAQLEAVAVQASMIAAGSLEPDLVGALVRHRKLAKRYLSIEGHRALVANAPVLPSVLASLANRDIADRSDSPRASLAIAASRVALEDPAPEFGVIRAAKVIAACARVAKQDEEAKPGHIPRSNGATELEELDDGEVDDSDDPDLFTSPVGGGGFIGKWLKKMLSSARKTGSGGGPPGVDNPTHRTNSGKRGVYAVASLASTSGDDADDDHAGQTAADGVRYPEWDVARKSYRPAWCTVREVAPQVKASATQAIDDAIGVRRPLSRLGMGLHRRHRQAQGDDIDIDAAVEARVEVRAGSVPDEAVYLDSLRRRRDLAVLLLLDVSGSAGEPGTVGRTVHQQQRAAVANLTVALHDLGDRVALYAYYSQGRRAVSMVPVKRFDDQLRPARGEHGARQAVRRPAERPGHQAAQQPGTGRVFTAGRGDPPRFGDPGGARRYVTAAAGGALRRTGLRPRIRAGLRRRRRAPRADRGPPPGDRLCMPDNRRRNRRAIAAPGVRQHRARDHRATRSARRCHRTAVPLRTPIGGGSPQGVGDAKSHNAVGARRRRYRPIGHLKQTSVPARLQWPEVAEGKLWPTSPGLLTSTAVRPTRSERKQCGPITRRSAAKRPFSRRPTARACRCS